MNDETKCCPECQWPLDEEAVSFCPNCGGKLASAGGNGYSDPTQEEGLETPMVNLSEREAGAGSFVCAVPAAAAGQGIVADVREPDVFGDSDCRDFDILYNASRLFVEGLEMPFQFRITALREGVADLCIEIRRRRSSYGGEALVARDEPAWIPVVGRQMDNPVGFRPETGSSGHVTFDIYFGYRHEGIKTWYLARKTHTVFQPKTNADSVIKELNIQFRNELSQGHAGDAQVHQTLNGIEKLVQAKKGYVEDFRELEVPELWVRLPLSRCLYKPLAGEGVVPQSPSVSVVQQRLSLRAEGRVMHVLSGAVLTLGRNRDNDIVTRVVGPDGTFPAKPNEKISRFHCRIQLQGDGCTLFDKGWDPTAKCFKSSVLGTSLDGCRVPKGQSVVLPANRDFTIVLAPEGQIEPVCYSLTGRLWTCGAIAQGATCRKSFPAHEPAALVLRPSGSTKVWFVMLWAFVPLSVLDSVWGDACLCRSRDSFLMGAEGRCEWLIPGHVVGLPAGRRVHVDPYPSDDPRE